MTYHPGDLLAVSWQDITRSTNAEPEEAQLAPCITWGLVHQLHRDKLVLMQSRYEDGSGDFTTIPRGAISGMQRLCKAEDVMI